VPDITHAIGATLTAVATPLLGSVRVPVLVVPASVIVSVVIAIDPAPPAALREVTRVFAEPAGLHTFEMRYGEHRAALTSHIDFENLF